MKSTIIRLVLRLMASGQSTRGIAREVSRDVRTIRKYIRDLTTIRCELAGQSGSEPNDDEVVRAFCASFDTKRYRARREVLAKRHSIRQWENEGFSWPDIHRKLAAQGTNISLSALYRNSLLIPGRLVLSPRLGTTNSQAKDFAKEHKGSKHIIDTTKRVMEDYDGKKQFLAQCAYAAEFAAAVTAGNIVLQKKSLTLKEMRQLIDCQRIVENWTKQNLKRTALKTIKDLGQYAPQMAEVFAPESIGGEEVARLFKPLKIAFKTLRSRRAGGGPCDILALRKRGADEQAEGIRRYVERALFPAIQADGERLVDALREILLIPDYTKKSVAECVYRVIAKMSERSVRDIRLEHKSFNLFGREGRRWIA